MAEVKKLTQEELQELKNIQESINSAVIELGQIELLKLELKARREAVDSYLQQIREREAGLAVQLEQIYGKGNIDLQTGEIVLL